MNRTSNATRESLQAMIDPATVLCREGARFGIKTQAGRVLASRAVSCLVLPEPGDRVLAAELPGEGWFILAVLTREGVSAVSVCAEGDLRIQAPHGRVSVAAEAGVDLVSTSTVSVTAAQVEMRAARGNVVIDALGFVGTAVVAQLDKVDVVARAMERTVERVTERVKRAYRFVEEIDQLRAERIDYVAKKNMSLRGQNALVTAQDLVKVDGAQIHMG